MKKTFAASLVASTGILIALLAAVPAFANHSWGGYHWARTANPFTLKLGDNVNVAWDSYLRSASNDWSASPSLLYPGTNILKALNTSVVAGSSNPKNCRATAGMVQVCNSAYGNNGWLGIAQIWINGTHITQGVVKLNDTYFNTPTYNKPSWRQFVMCQEVGHTFGLDHQDEVFGNANLGTCMDYTNDPARNDGAGNNLHPNQHDYDELAFIYAHLDTTTTVSKTKAAGASALAQSGDFENASEWGKSIRTSEGGKQSVYERDLGNGQKVFTFVIWVQ